MNIGRRMKRRGWLVAALCLTAVGLLSGNNGFCGPTDTLWIQDWEDPSWMTDWHVDYGTWEVGIPTSGPGAAHQPDNCAATVLDGNYSDGQDTRLILHTPFLVPDASENPRLRFWHWYNLNAADGGYVQIRVAGETDWQTLGAGIYGHTTDAGYGHGYSQGWTRPLLELSDYAGQTVQFAFLLYSSNSGGGPADVDPGWYIDEVLVETGDYVYSNPEDWESGFDDWYADYGTWEVGEPTSGPGAAHEGLNCTGTNLEGDYHDAVSSRLISPAFVVPDASANPRLRFWHWYNLNAADGGYVQIRVAGETDWQTLGAGIYGHTTDAGYGHGYSQGWTRPLLELSDYAGQTVQFAFLLYSSNSGGGPADVDPGWYIDEVLVETGDYVYSNPEDWESGFDDWYADYGTWEVGTPTYGLEQACEGTMLAATNLEGVYYDGVSSRLISPAFVVPDASLNARLRFYHWYNFNSGDAGYVQIRPVGETDWQTLDSYSGYVGVADCAGPTYHPLTDYAGQAVQLAFHFYSSNSGGGPVDVDPGWYVDYILVETTCPNISCPDDPIDVSRCSLGEICVDLPVLNASEVDPGDAYNASWSDGQLCFTADAPGQYDFTIVASNPSCEDVCDLTVNVTTDLTIDLGTGWNFISMNQEPLSMSLTDLMSAFPDEVNIVKGGDGRFWFNGAPCPNPAWLCEWNVINGYKVHMKTPQTMTASGDCVDPGTPTPIRTGFSIKSIFQGDFESSGLSCKGSFLGT